MYKHVSVASALLLLSAFGLFGLDSIAAPKQKQEQDEPTPLANFMRAKLDASGQILEGLCTEDFALIETGARKLTIMSEAAQWRVTNDAMYRQHSAEFQDVAKRLQKAAKETNLEGAALAWIDATMSCIECHRWVRTMLVAEKGGPPDGGADRFADARLQLLGLFGSQYGGPTVESTSQKAPAHVR